MLLCGAIGTSVGLAGCDRGGRGGDRAAFCAAIDKHGATLFQPLADPTREQFEDLLELWREIEESAPLAVEDDWAAMGDVIEEGLEGDDDQVLLATGYTSERSALAVSEWLATNCSYDLPVATVVDHDAGPPTSDG